MFTTSVSIIFITYLIFYKCKFSKNFLNPMDMIQAKMIKGILSILIMLGHIFTNSNILITPFSLVIISVGFLCVGMFFFYSGFGLGISYKRKESYLDTFLIKKLKEIYIPFVLMNILYYIILELLVGKKDFSIKEIVITASGYNLINGISWYVVAIIYFYLLFFFCFKYFTKIRYLMFFLSMLLYYYICLKYNNSATWLRVSIFPIFLGMLYSEYKEKIDIILKNNYMTLVCSCLALFNFFYLVRFNRVKDLLKISMSDFYFSEITVIFFCFLIILGLMKIKLQNKTTLKIGEISFEIYLYHGLFIKIFKALKIENTFIYVLLCVVSTLILSVIIKKLHSKVIKF